MSFLDIISLTRRFGGLKAVDNLNLSIEEGSLTAIIGPNGCGKSTLFNLICGALKPDIGTIILDGVHLENMTATEIARHGVGRKFQVPSIFDDLTVMQNIHLPTLRKSRFASEGPSWTVQQILELTKLAHRKYDLGSELSHGEKQWLEIAMILSQSPRVILLDEPTAGMSLSETEQTADLIKSINANNNATVLVIEHDIGFIERLNCPLHVMSSGTLLKSGNFLEIRQDTEVQELYFGKAGDFHA
ncbi:ATP-binding cassette domain-containing protein [Sneathiella glossodoripedis]|uniref:ATP-binding cassette domain-containing protein n=1 Tax=Sneathiella glossodoripedis TaxID=418853 RepID=UPI00046EA762|nr:ATP-binding cassette domain-containing protein [Sneathiella glossodoripedis]